MKVIITKVEDGKKKYQIFKDDVKQIEAVYDSSVIRIDDDVYKFSSDAILCHSNHVVDPLEFLLHIPFEYKPGSNLEKMTYKNESGVEAIRSFETLEDLLCWIMRLGSIDDGIFYLTLNSDISLGLYITLEFKFKHDFIVEINNVNDYREIIKREPELLYPELDVESFFLKTSEYGDVEMVRTLEDGVLMFKPSEGQFDPVTLEDLKMFKSLKGEDSAYILRTVEGAGFNMKGVE